MSKTRPELSEKSKYYIPKHRYYELKHFVMQYPEWNSIISEYDDGLSKSPPIDMYRIINSDIPDPTWHSAYKAIIFSHHVNMINNVAENLLEVDKEIGYTILFNILEDRTYETSKKYVPYSRDFYYKLYRKFFWMLDKERD